MFIRAKYQTSSRAVTRGGVLNHSRAVTRG